MRRPRLATTFQLVLALGLAGCASDGAIDTPPASASVGLPQASGTDAAPSATSSAPGFVLESANPAPIELAGVWRRFVQGEEVHLTLRDTGYHIQRGPASGSGRISVTADTIEFFGSARCDGRGSYTWSFEEERLRFVEIEDPCSGRTDVLLLGTFGRISD